MHEFSEFEKQRILNGFEQSPVPRTYQESDNFPKSFARVLISIDSQNGLDLSQLLGALKAPKSHAQEHLSRRKCRIRSIVDFQETAANVRHVIEKL
jgi:hypothetical protein